MENDLATIERSLPRLFSSPGFVKSPRQRDLLRYLVDQTLAGNADRLKGYVIGVEVFGRGADFDPALDAIVRVEVGRLRSKLREYYEGDGETDAVMVALPKGGYAVEFRQRNAARPESASTKPAPAGVDERPSLVVLPLSNLGPEPGNDYFADGITDSLIFELSRLSGLFLISRQSSFAYRNSPLSSEAIAAALGVGFLLQGSVQRAGNRVRVTVQLIDASTGGPLLSERFDRDIQDIFALQDEVTRSIVRALQIRLAPAEAELFGHEGTASVEAHDALLRGYESHWKYTPKSIVEARHYFSQAVEYDLQYAPAHAWLARSMLHQWMMKWDTTPGLRDHAVHHARLAVELNPRLPYAVAILGWVYLWCKQRDSSIACCRQAVSMDSNNPELLNFLSMTLSSAGFGEEALFYSERARRLNPHSSPFYEFVLGQSYFVMEDYEKAIIAFRRGCELSEHFIPNHAYLCTVYEIVGMEDKMRERRDHVLALIGGDLKRMIEPPWTDEALEKFYRHLMRSVGLEPLETS